MIAMSNNYIHDWDYRLENALSKNILDRVVKFHQSSTFLPDRFCKSSFENRAIYNFYKEAEGKDIVPIYFDEKIDFDIEKTNWKGSTRVFENAWIMPKNIIGEILYNSFGRGKTNSSKRYPSAGALYPVIPLVYIFSSSAVEGIRFPGCYMFDSTGVSLLSLKHWNSHDLSEIASVINVRDGYLLSNTAIGYAIDMRRAVAKYRLKGYRHALIEVGLMAQSFRETVNEINEDLGEVCWSGFRDNALTFYSGLNVRLAPVVLVQWFGKRKG